MLRQCKTARCCRGTAEDFRCPETLVRVERCVSFAGKNTAFVPPQRPEPAACARPAHRRRELPLGERLGERLPCRLPSRFPSRKFDFHCSACSAIDGGSSTVPPSSSSGHWPSLRPGALSLRRRALHGSLTCTSFVAHLVFFRGGVPGSPPPAMMRATTTSCGERLPLRATCAASAASARGFVSDERRRRRLHAIARRLKSGLRQSRGHLRAV